MAAYNHRGQLTTSPRRTILSYGREIRTTNAIFFLVFISDKTDECMHTMCLSTRSLCILLIN
jgi:hypothetical protein